MGFRFRRTLKILPGVRLNLTHRSASVRLGPRGAGYTISSTGRHTVSAGIPGTGISYQETFTPGSGTQKGVRAVHTVPQQVSQSQPRTGHTWVSRVFIVGLFVVALWAIWPKSNDSAPSATAHVQPAVARGIEEKTVPPPPPSPPVTRSLSTDEVREVQLLLKELGFDPGGADGIVGPMTIAAVKRYEPSRGWPASGEIDVRLLESLRASKAAPRASAVKSAPSAPVQAPPPVTVVPNEEMRLAARVIREAEHPCGTVAAAVRLSDGSVRAVCSNSEIYRVMSVRGEWIALKCSAAQRLGVQGC